MLEKVNTLAYFSQFKYSSIPGAERIGIKNTLQRKSSQDMTTISLVFPYMFLSLSLLSGPK